ncbi:SMODS domain-containing nucleotidyltransferase [Carnobacterium maltaromaticum]|uniref:SMODS domain-containing nucleotidyltransferase n=1 Tax=Carnobacterium maltaromaticum TaxID=2751 RepID=UPI00295F30E1|nr:nucleotidyltransferase domain-containing protein [Carnobacterium maltaromaticum]
MSILVTNSYVTPLETRQTIARRYRAVTKVINVEFWNSISETAHSFYVGSYGRGTAISTSDIDILVEIPNSEYDKFNLSTGNKQSRLLQLIRKSLQVAYPRSDIRADGQVVKINFHDGIKFEILPVFQTIDYFGNHQGYIYPDTNMGGNWKATNPKSEQEAMKVKNGPTYSNGLLYATCRHFRYVRDTYFTSYHLSGIVIDSFIYNAMGNWRYTESGSSSSASKGDYEKILLEYFNNKTIWGLNSLNLNSPGSNQTVNTSSSIACLEKVIKKIAT